MHDRCFEFIVCYIVYSALEALHNALYKFKTYLLTLSMGFAT